MKLIQITLLLKKINIFYQKVLSPIFLSSILFSFFLIPGVYSANYIDLIISHNKIEVFHMNKIEVFHVNKIEVFLVNKIEVFHVNYFLYDRSTDVYDSLLCSLYYSRQLPAMKQVVKISVADADPSEYFILLLPYFQYIHSSLSTLHRIG